MANNANYSAINYVMRQYTHPPGILVSDHYIKPFGYQCYRPEGTKDWLIMLTLEGKGILHNGAVETVECTENTFTIIPPGVVHHFYTAENEVWEKLWAHFIPRSAWLNWLPESNTNGPIFHMNIDHAYTCSAIKAAFNRILSYRMDAYDHYRDELILNALEEIILLIASYKKETKQLDPRIKEILDILTQSFAEQHRIEHLAKRVCLSPSRLSHLFKDQVGESIIETLLKNRLRQAEKLLKYTTRPIIEIAFEVGFNSSDYFTRQFSAYYGVSPQQFRKKNI